MLFYCGSVQERKKDFAVCVRRKRDTTASKQRKKEPFTYVPTVGHERPCAITERSSTHYRTTIEKQNKEWKGL